ncbi:MAG: IPT/TIG domain-containing protein, partial [Gammaproteobacteria bacterium]
GKEVQIYSQTDKKFDPAMQAETHVYFDKAEATVKSVTADVITVTTPKVSAAGEFPVKVTQGKAETTSKKPFGYYKLLLDPPKGPRTGIQQDLVITPTIDGVAPVVADVFSKNQSEVSVTFEGKPSITTFKSFTQSSLTIDKSLIPTSKTDVSVVVKLQNTGFDSASAIFTYITPTITSVTRFNKPAVVLNGGGKLPQITTAGDGDAKGRVVIWGDNFGTDKTKIKSVTVDNTTYTDQSAFDLIKDGDKVGIALNQVPGGTLGAKVDIKVEVDGIPTDPAKQVLEYVGVSAALTKHAEDGAGLTDDSARRDGGDTVTANGPGGFKFSSNSFMSFNKGEIVGVETATSDYAVQAKTPLVAEEGAIGLLPYGDVDVHVINGPDSTYENAVAKGSLHVYRVYLQCIKATDPPTTTCDKPPTTVAGTDPVLRSTEIDKDHCTKSYRFKQFYGVNKVPKTDKNTMRCYYVTELGPMNPIYYGAQDDIQTNKVGYDFKYGWEHDSPGHADSCSMDDVTVGAGINACRLYYTKKH